MEVMGNVDGIIITSELMRRSCRLADYVVENRALIELTHAMARNPRDLFEVLVQTSLTLCRAQSAGISLLNEKEGRFIWPAVAGKFAKFVGGGTPRNFGPCGTVRSEQIFGNGAAGTLFCLSQILGSAGGRSLIGALLRGRQGGGNALGGVARANSQI